MAKKAKSSKKSATKPAPRSTGNWVKDPQLYTLEVFITSGMMMTKKFIKKNPEISRKIQIRGNQTLADLHQAIFDAYDREDEHLYEFQFGKRTHEGPMYRRRMPPSTFGFEEEADIGIAEDTRLDSLGLNVDRAFGYWFDFGDDWMHQINVVAIDAAAPKGKYPKVISRVGASPPQYLDMEEMEE
jgi:hypothetical protein